MRYIAGILISLFLLIGLISCSATNVHLPRSSFVKIKTEWKVEHCKQDIEWEEGEGCTTLEYKSSGSGSIIIHDVIQSYILTAGHICDIEHAMGLIHNSVPKGLEYRILDANGRYHTARIYKVDRDNDICILQTSRLTLPAIKFRNNGPKFGEKFYNLAAPAGFAGTNYVPLVEGRYSGFTARHMVFSIPAVGGSSGSPIFDKNGEMTGMIILIHIRIPFLSMSPHYDALKKMIEEI